MIEKDSGLTIKKDYFFPVWKNITLSLSSFIQVGAYKKHNKMICALNQDSDQTKHMPNLTTVFCCLNQEIISTSSQMSEQWRIWVNVQARRSLQWGHNSFLSLIMYWLVINWNCQGPTCLLHIYIYSLAQLVDVPDCSCLLVRQKCGHVTILCNGKNLVRRVKELNQQTRLFPWSKRSPHFFWL